MKNLPWKPVHDYTRAVNKFGPDSKDAINLRAKHAKVEGFLQYADNVDAKKRKENQKALEDLDKKLNG